MRRFVVECFAANGFSLGYAMAFSRGHFYQLACTATRASAHAWHASAAAAHLMDGYIGKEVYGAYGRAMLASYVVVELSAEEAALVDFAEVE